MTQEEELKKIKKVYGENFMKMCRSLFPTIMEEEGSLYEILTSTFSDNSETLYEDIQAQEKEAMFKDIIYSKFERKKAKPVISVNKTPYELLDEAGYELIECTTEEEIQSFKKYYAEGEDLCSFNGGRLDKRVVFFAVKKDVENIKREDFENPQREDEYGTSVMSIQFDKEGICIPTIICRYNHGLERKKERGETTEEIDKKENPDATYRNDLDKIVLGLESSFRKLLEERGLELNTLNKDAFELPGYIVAGDGKTYKYNFVLNDIYYCPGNIIIKDGEVCKLPNPEHQILIDNFVLDTKEKTIKLYDPEMEDSFIDGLQNIDKIEVTRDKETKNRVITLQREEEAPIIIEIDRENKIVGYENHNLTEIGDYFLRGGTSLQRLDVPKVKKIGDCCLARNKMLTRFETNAEIIGDNFADSNEILNELIARDLKKVGYYFLGGNKCVKVLDLPSLKYAEEGFFENDEAIEKINVPKNKKIEERFKGIIEANNPQREENNKLENDKWMNRFGSWYSALDKVSESVKSKFVKMKSDIINAISGKLKERTNNTQENEQNQDTEER